MKRLGILLFPMLFLWFYTGVFLENSLNKNKGVLYRICKGYFFFGAVCLVLAFVGTLVYMIPTIAKALLICGSIWLLVGSVVLIVSFIRHPTPIHVPRSIPEAFRALRSFVEEAFVFGVPVTAALAVAGLLLFGILAFLSYISGLAP